MELRTLLQECLTGRVRFVGLGNEDMSDDGLGMALARKLARSGCHAVLLAGTTPERWLGQLADGRADTVVFLDAVEGGTAPGSVVILDTAQLESRFPQISTHKLSLGLLSHWVESGGVARAWLIGVQPESLAAGNELSPVVAESVEALAVLLETFLGASEPVSQAPCESPGVPETAHVT